MRSVGNAECRKCGVWKTRSAKSAELKKKFPFQFSIPYFSNVHDESGKRGV